MKTHAPSHVRRLRAFTLMELLVVMVVIAILAGFLAPQIVEMFKQRDVLKTMELITKLKTGISGFHAEYNRFPTGSDASTGGEDVEVLTDGSTPIIAALTGIPVENGGEDWNPKRMSFAEFLPAQNERHGLVNSSWPPRLHDLWGNPFHILFDTSGDHQVKNPDAQNSEARISRPGGKPVGGFLASDVIIFSAGRDGLSGTADDIVSWRQN